MPSNSMLLLRSSSALISVNSVMALKITTYHVTVLLADPRKYKLDLITAWQ